VRGAVPAAASTRLADVLAAPPRPATVLAALPGVVYVAADAGLAGVGSSSGRDLACGVLAAASLVPAETRAPGAVTVAS
ncbi:MAG: hypothetical protein M3P96_12965, partial [Actinomycetota bacterium]|nr:hypothetical protein [Actinomycetota bacterium]